MSAPLRVRRYAVAVIDYLVANLVPDPARPRRLGKGCTCVRLNGRRAGSLGDVGDFSREANQDQSDVWCQEEEKPNSSRSEDVA